MPYLVGLYKKSNTEPLPLPKLLNMFLYFKIFPAEIKEYFHEWHSLRYLLFLYTVYIFIYKLLCNRKIALRKLQYDVSTRLQHEV